MIGFSLLLFMKFTKLLLHNKNLLLNTLPLNPSSLPLPYKINKSIVLVGSGKGGVGKSTASLNLCFTLSRMGYKCALLDLDLYGPSIPLMTNTMEHQSVFNGDNEKFEPCLSYGGVELMSIQYLLKSGSQDVSANTLRGPLSMKMLRNLLFNTQFGLNTQKEIDFLVLDTPPGTSDVNIGIMQLLKGRRMGVVLVSTPQNVALLDVQKSYYMFHKQFSAKVFGLVENLKYFQCSNCGTKGKLFSSTSSSSSSSGKKREYLNDIEILGQLGMSQEMLECCEEGVPYVVKYWGTDMAQEYRKIAQRIIEQVDNENKDIK